MAYRLLWVDDEIELLHGHIIFLQSKGYEVTTMTNGQEGYIPSALGYKNGGYSTDITRFAPGTGEELVADYLEILQKIHP